MRKRGFTIIEVELVILFIALLVVGTFISYNTIRSNATATALKSDLSNAYEELDVFQVQKGNFPTTIDCSVANSSTNLCLKSGQGISLSYQYNNSISPKGYCITAASGSTYYSVQGSSSANSTLNYINGVCNACAAVPSGLLLCLDAGSSISYPGSGTTWYDLSGSGNNGTLLNGTSFTSISPSAFIFDQIDDSVNLGNISLSTSALSVSAWVYDSDTSGGHRDIVTKYGHFKFRIDSDAEGGKLSSFVWIGGNPEPRISAVWTKNTWTNVAFTWNTNGNFKLFINGALKSSSTTRTGTLNTSSNDLTVGSDRTTNYSKAKISTVTIHNSTLTDSEILQEFNVLKSRYGL